MGKLITGIAVLVLVCSGLAACGSNHGAGITTSTTTSLVDSADQSTAKNQQFQTIDVRP